MPSALVRGLVLSWFGAAAIAVIADLRPDSSRVDIPGGSYLMGTATADVAGLRRRYGVVRPGVFENETPARRVTLSPFRIDALEVSTARFAEFVASNPAWSPSGQARERNGDYLALWKDGSVPPGRRNHPVVFVTWAAAQSFCEWAGGRLPTEAEWEYVARSGDDREFPWGDDLPSAEKANYSASNIDDTTPVGSYPPNAFGVYDLAGNVWEFLLDEWVVNHPPASAVDPIAGGPPDADAVLSVTGRRAVRGASYGGSIVNLRTRWRDSHMVDNAVAFVGFRCAYPAQ